MSSSVLTSAASPRTNKLTGICALLCILLGAGYSNELRLALRVDSPPPAQPALPVRMTMRAAPPAVAVGGTPSRLPIETATPAPVKPKTGQHARALKPTAPIAPSVVAAPSPAGADAAPAAPFWPAMQPAATPDHFDELKGRVYTQQPGGETLVIAILVDSDGRVIAQRTMVPSKHPVDDLVQSLALKGQKIVKAGVVKPGDTLWLDWIVNYAASQPVELP